MLFGTPAERKKIDVITELVDLEVSSIILRTGKGFQFIVRWMEKSAQTGRA